METFLFFRTRKVINITFFYILQAKETIFNQKIPGIRICLPHWQSYAIWLCLFVAYVLTKLEALPTKTYKFCGQFRFKLFDVALETRQIIEKF